MYYTYTLIYLFTVQSFSGFRELVWGEIDGVSGEMDMETTFKGT